METTNKRDARFELRLPGEVKTAAMNRAKKMGVSLADLLNQLIRREILNQRAES